MAPSPGCHFFVFFKESIDSGTKKPEPRSSSIPLLTLKLKTH